MAEVVRGRSWKLFGIFFGILVLYVLATSWAFPSDESGQLQSPDWYSLLGVALSWGLTWGYARWKRWPRAKLGWSIVGVFLWTAIAYMTVMAFFFPDYISSTEEFPEWVEILQVLLPGLAAWLYVRREKARKAAIRAAEAVQKEAQAQTAAQEAQKRQRLDRCEDYLRQLRKLDEAIPGQEVSEQLVRMGNTLEQIFGWVREHPGADVRQLMEYYLPMTMKLLETYAGLDALNTEGENIRSSKLRIEQTLEELNRAYEKLLDDLVAQTALDVSSDIAVLKAMLTREGLAEDDLTWLS